MFLYQLNELNDIIYSYLTVYSLSQLFQTCKYFYINEETFTEKHWKELCFNRWRVNNGNHLKRIYGSNTYKICYHILSYRKIPPKTKYTEKYKKVLGYNKNEGIHCWLYLNHTQDSKPRRRLCNGKIQYYLTFRLCIQNNRHGLISLTTKLASDSVKVVSKDYVDSDPKIVPSKNVKLLDFSNKDQQFPKLTHDYDLISLLYMQYAIISFDVDCSQQFLNEIDLLCSLSHIQISPRIIISDSHSLLKQLIDISCYIYQEEKLWEYYEVLPGRVVLLKRN